MIITTTLLHPTKDMNEDEWLEDLNKKEGNNLPAKKEKNSPKELCTITYRKLYFEFFALIKSVSKTYKRI